MTTESMVEADQNYVSFSMEKILDALANEDLKKYIKTDYYNQLEKMIKQEDKK